MGINNPNVVEGLKVNTMRDAQSELQMWDVKASGDLYDLPGGTLAVAIGAETAKEESSDVADSLSMSNKIVASGGTSNAGSRSREAEYVEFMIPIIGEENRVTGIHSLGIQAAWRFEQYSDFGSTDNPKVGFKYAPWERLLLRSTYQTAFRAPSLYQLYMGESISYPFLRDPARGDDGMQYRTKSGGNEDLMPEETDSVSAGAVIDIPMPENMTLHASVNWSSHELENVITSIGAQYMLNNEELFKDKIVRNPQTDEDKEKGIPGSIQYINSSYQNLAEQRVEALDFGLDYTIKTSVGVFDAGLAATYQYKYDNKPRPKNDDGSPASFLDEAGSYGAPEWRGKTSLFWYYDKYSAGATVNYVDSFDQLYGAVSEVDSFTTLDLQASYDLTDNSRLTIGAANVTDEEAPWSDSEPEGYAFSAAGHNPLGTMLYGRFEVRF